MSTAGAPGPSTGKGPRQVGAAFAPSDPAFVADPYPAYARLREDGRVLYDPGTDHWLVPHHADVNALLRDRRFGRTYLHVASHAEMGHREEPAYLAPFWHLIRNGMLDREPPDHTRLRRLVAKAFTPRMVERLRGRVQANVDRLVDRLADAGGGDLVAEVAEPLSVAVISDLLGVPEADRPLLRPWSAQICGMYEVNPTEEAGRVASRAATEFSGYMRELSRARRDRPADDLVTALTQVVDGGDQLTEDELIGTVVLLLNAGHEATVNFTGIGWWQLFRHPDQLARLRREPGLLPRAVDELLRYDTPLQMFERWVLEDVEIRGVAVPKGAELGLLFGSANRDPAVFEDPDRLDLAREAAPQHLSFGAGVHYCLGAPLGRLELELSFGTLLARLPRMEPAAEPAWKPTYVLRGLEALDVTV
ncbi:MAG TPA: cytochrome P450 [Actinomycetes bacterium]|nr:cytochrome P450 [Actinomycetes bacterium]